MTVVFQNQHLTQLSRHEAKQMTTITIWHNPRCSKSRTALALLEEHGAQPTQRRYLETAPTESEIRRVLSLLGVPAIDLMRRGETAFNELNLASDTPEDELISAMASHPILIERPIIISANQAVIGRPPENALALV
jgi:arsenate reductase